MDLVQSARQLVRQILGGTGQSSSTSRRPTGQPESTRPRPGTTRNLGGSGSTGRAVNTRPTSRVTTGAGITGGGGVTRLSATATGSRNPRVTIGAGMSGPGNTFRPVAGPTPGIPTGAGTSFTPNRVGPPDAVVGGRPLGTQATLNGKPVVWLPTGKNTAGWQPIAPAGIKPAGLAGTMGVLGGLAPLFNEGKSGSATYNLLNKIGEATRGWPYPLRADPNTDVGKKIGDSFGSVVDYLYKGADDLFFNGRLPGGAEPQGETVPPSQSEYARRRGIGAYDTTQEPTTNPPTPGQNKNKPTGITGERQRSPGSQPSSIPARSFTPNGVRSTVERQGSPGSQSSPSSFSTASTPTPGQIRRPVAAVPSSRVQGTMSPTTQAINSTPDGFNRQNVTGFTFPSSNNQGTPGYVVNSEDLRRVTDSFNTQLDNSLFTSSVNPSLLSPEEKERYLQAFKDYGMLPVNQETVNPYFDNANTAMYDSAIKAGYNPSVRVIDPEKAREAVRAAATASQSNPFDVNPPPTGPANNNSAEVISVDTPSGQPTTPVISQPTTNLAEFYKEMQRIGEQNIEPIISSLGYEGSKAEWARANEALAYRELLKQMTNSR